MIYDSDLLFHEPNSNGDMLMSYKLFRAVFLVIGLLTTSLVFGDSSDPISLVEKFFSHFNKMDKEKLNQVSDSPFVFRIGGSTTKSDRYGDLVNFDGLQKLGWTYSKLARAQVIY